MSTAINARNELKYGRHADPPGLCFAIPRQGGRNLHQACERPSGGSLHLLRPGGEWPTDSFSRFFNEAQTLIDTLS